MKLIIELDAADLTEENVALIGEITGAKKKIKITSKSKETVKEEKKVTKEEKQETLSEPEEEIKDEESGEEKITLEDLKKLGADIAHNGGKDDVKAVIKSFGVTKLTEIPEEKYAEVMAKLKELEDEEI